MNDRTLNKKLCRECFFTEIKISKYFGCVNKQGLNYEI